MIVLNLKEILENVESYENRFVLSPKEIKLPPEVGNIEEPVKVHLRVTKEREGYKVKIKMKGAVDLECSRCLEVFRKIFYQEIEKHVEPYPKEDNLTLLPEDLDVSFMEEPDVVYLEDLVREEILLSIPMKPLCKPNCSGFYELSKSSAEDTSIDPRFAILKNLLTG